MRARTLSSLQVLAGLLAWSAPASAFDAATTHAGLTERAVAASSLPRRLNALFTWGTRRIHGLYETLQLANGDPRSAELGDRLERLDPAGGVRPEGGRLTALGWLVAGSVLEEVPPSRARNHFIDPQSGAGLDLSGAGSLVARIGSPGVRSGAPSTAWLLSPDNDLSVLRFLELRERALVSPDPAVRDAAAAEALLAAGALLHVVEDGAHPAYVHNDFNADLHGADAPFSRYVAARYGRLAVPRPRGPAEPLVHLADVLHNDAHTGLADRTAVRFFSVGSLAARAGQGGSGAVFPPSMPALSTGPSPEGYLEDAAHRRIAHYYQGVDGVRWDLDANCYQDAAAVLLPEAGQAALSALEHLFRGDLAFEGSVVTNGGLPLGAGRLHVLVEEADGKRRELAATEVTSAAAGGTLGSLPPEAEGQRVVVVYRGVDGAGEPVVLAGERSP